MPDWEKHVMSDDQKRQSAIHEGEIKALMWAYNRVQEFSFQDNAMFGIK